jgi:hypothetical protein
MSTMIGSNVTISVLVKNIGKDPENSTVIALANGLSVAQMNFTNLAAGANITITLTWATNNYAAGPYVIGGQVLGVPGEASLADNIRQSSTPVTLTPPNSGISGYLVPAIITALVVIIGIVSLLFLQTKRRKTAREPPVQS